jgi:glutamate synthase (NADPH/NADH) large chain
LVRPDSGGLPTRNMTVGRNEVPETLDAQMIIDAAAALEDGEKMQLTYNVNNTQRAIGTKLSHKIVTRYGLNGLQPGHISIKLRGSCGQSLGAFATQGLKLYVVGDSNDYVGKGLSGATIIIRPAQSSNFETHLNTIIGNTVLYGATSGTLFAAGQAGERFCVRNSGATAIVEGCGSNGCEYMTGGKVIILGSVGPNFGAGMTGGMAFVYDTDHSFKHRVNEETVIYQRIKVGHYETVLRNLIMSYHEETVSKWAEKILVNWDKEVSKFWQIVPKEMLQKLEIPVTKPKPNNFISSELKN